MSRTVVAGSAVTTPAFELLDADVREQVRRSGIDPLTEVETVRRLAQSAVRAHDDRSLSGTVRPVEDPERVVAELIARVAGSVRCSATSTTPRSRRCGSTSRPGCSWPVTVDMS